MPKKKPDNKIHIIETPEGEFRPLFVAGRDIGKVVLGLSAKTAANWRSAKVGPQFSMCNGTPYYRITDLEAYFWKNPVQTIDGADQ
jgi:hypothetical protein